MGQPQVAVYWDFENIHASVLDLERGAGAYRRAAWSRQEAVVDVDAILEYAASLGRVVVNRAYGNWQWMDRYRDDVLQHSIDLVQLYPASGAKNGADIRLALDVLQDLLVHEDITHVVVVAGDSDFIPLAQRTRRLGRHVIGVSVQQSASPHWVAACDEFKFYRALQARRGATSEEITEEVLDEREAARELLVRAVRQLAASSPEPGWGMKAALRPLLTRLDPSFDVAALGYRDLDAYLDDNHDLVERRVGSSDHLLRLRSTEDAPKPVAAGASGSERTAEKYATALKRQGIRLLPPDRLHLGLRAAARLHGRALSRTEIDAELAGELGGEEPDTDARKVRQLLFKARCFDYDPETGVMRLEPDEDELPSKVLDTLAVRLDSTLGPVEPDALATLLFGPEPADADRARAEAAVAGALTVTD